LKNQNGKREIKLKRGSGCFSSMPACYCSISAHPHVRAWPAFRFASPSLIDGARLSRLCPRNLPLLHARVAMPTKLQPSSRPLITTSTLQCRHMCVHALEPSHRLLVACSIVSTLSPLCYHRRCARRDTTPGARRRSIAQPVPLAELTRPKARRLGPCVAMPACTCVVG
jgi:hypothetical protein